MTGLPNDYHRSATEEIANLREDNVHTVHGKVSFLFTLIPKILMMFHWEECALNLVNIITVPSFNVMVDICHEARCLFFMLIPYLKDTNSC